MESQNPLTANTVAPLSVSERYGSNQLLDARVVLISQEKCKAPHVYGDSLDDSMFCAGNMDGGVDSCQVLKMTGFQFVSISFCGPSAAPWW